MEYDNLYDEVIGYDGLTSMPKPKNDLVARVAAIAENAKNKQISSEPRPVRLPTWPAGARAIPNGFLRSALFGVVKHGARQYLKAEVLAAVDGVAIKYTGERLNQGDLDTFESVLHVARLQNLNDKCYITSYALLKLMGLTDSGKNRATLHTRITRLVATAVDVKSRQYSYIGSLITEAAKDELTSEWVITLNPKLCILFSSDQFTLVDWGVRQALTGKPLAQWLHGFYASHATPYPMRVETLHKLCGSDARVMSDFTKTLRNALDAVKAACKGFSYEIDNGLVSVKKKASKSQKNHIYMNTPF